MGILSKGIDDKILIIEITPVRFAVSGLADGWAI